MSTSIINTNTTKAVLSAWVEGFLVDVPAVHRDGEYLIDAEVLRDHVHNLGYDQVVEVMLEAEAKYL